RRTSSDLARYDTEQVRLELEHVDRRHTTARRPYHRLAAVWTTAQMHRVVLRTDAQHLAARSELRAAVGAAAQHTALIAHHDDFAGLAARKHVARRFRNRETRSRAHTGGRTIHDHTDAHHRLTTGQPAG